MLQRKVDWQKFEISPDHTHHVVQGKPAYPTKFFSVLKFHEPGLAPVKNETGAFHINPMGEAAYPNRFLKTFGFYEGKAAVQDPSGWYHISKEGQEIYPQRYAWCGNYQEGYCSVKTFQGDFFHIDAHGKKPYPGIFSYAGDFHDGYAVVQNREGLHTHIDSKGNLLHGKWFLDLDVYHKNFARARDTKGWFHIHFKGDPVYKQRYKSIEPFYNGVSRVETHVGTIDLIDERGEHLQTVRETLQDEFHEVSGELVSYWRFYTLCVATEEGIFDLLPSRLEEIATATRWNENSTLKLLRALQEMGFVHFTEHKNWICTNKGLFLQSNHPYTLKAACQLWKEEHLNCWSHLTYTLKTGDPVFKHLYGKEWFEWLRDDFKKNTVYHTALSTYAKRDYQKFYSLIDWTRHSSVLDIGGSTGTLLFNLLYQNLNLKGFLIDLPHVISLLKIPSNLKDRIECIPINFFEDWPLLKVESAVLSRVLHDWPDEQALKILQKTYFTLSDHSDHRLYIIEKIQEENSCDGALLDLHMLLMTGGVERTLKDFEQLLRKANFSLEDVKPLNQVSSVLIAKKQTDREK